LTLYPSVDRTSSEKKEMVENLYLSGMDEEFIALQVDLDIATVLAILEEFELHSEASWRSQSSG